MRDVELGRHERAPAVLGLLEDRHRAVALHRRLELRAARGLRRLALDLGVGVQAVVVDRAHAVTASRSAATAAPRTVDEAVDVLARALLGDRDQQAVVLEREAGVDALGGAALDDGVHGRVEPTANSRTTGCSCSSSTPSSSASAVARVGGALQQQLAELDEAAAAEPAQVDHAGERVERLRGADVVRRLLAADVLLARLQREHEAAAAVDVASSRRRCGRACGAGRPPGRRRSRTTARRSRAGCRASAPPPRRRRRRTRRAA